MGERFKTYAVVDKDGWIQRRSSKNGAESAVILYDKKAPHAAPHRAVLLVAVTEAEAARLGGEAGEVLIYSHAVGAWWAANGAGYTNDPARAGTFDIADAMARIGSGRNWRSGQEPRNTPADSIVPVRFRTPTPVVKEPLTTEPTPTVPPPGYGAAGGEAEPTPPATVDGAEAFADQLHGKAINSPYWVSCAIELITTRDAAVRADERAKCQKELDEARAEIARLHAACGALQDLYREQRDKIEKLEAVGAGVDKELLETARAIYAAKVASGRSLGAKDDSIREARALHAAAKGGEG